MNIFEHIIAFNTVYVTNIVIVTLVNSIIEIFKLCAFVSPHLPIVIATRSTTGLVVCYVHVQIENLNKNKFPVCLLDMKRFFF